MEDDLTLNERLLRDLGAKPAVAATAPTLHPEFAEALAWKDPTFKQLKAAWEKEARRRGGDPSKRSWCGVCQLYDPT